MSNMVASMAERTQTAESGIPFGLVPVRGRGDDSGGLLACLFEQGPHEEREECEAGSRPFVE